MNLKMDNQIVRIIIKSQTNSYLIISLSGILASMKMGALAKAFENKLHGSNIKCKYIQWVFFSFVKKWDVTLTSAYSHKYHLTN